MLRFGDARMVGGTLNLFDNDALVSLTGLENLWSIGHALYIGANPQLTSLVGLSGLTSLGATNPWPGSTLLDIGNNAMLPACWVDAIEVQTGVQCGFEPWSCSDNSGSGSCGP